MVRARLSLPSVAVVVDSKKKKKKKTFSGDGQADDRAQLFKEDRCLKRKI
jgi:hypothetical protein